MLRRLALALALIALPAPAPAQDRDPAAVLAKFRGYLEARPFHEAAFERLIESVVSLDGLPELIAEYEAALAQPEPARAARIVLARLYAATERAEEALALLAGLEGEETELHLLRGRLALEAGRAEDASAALDAAAATTDDARLLEEIHRARGRARLAAGDSPGARAAFEDLAAIDPASFHLRFACADALAEAGLADEAIAAYLAAGDLAGADAARRCRALAAAGALLETRDRPDEAIARYDQAVDLMARGNWLKRDLLGRVLAASRRAGSLEVLAARTRAHVAARPTDLDRRELLAAALIELRALDEARAVLSAASADFPDDLALGRRLLDLLETQGDASARVSELQRLIGRHPDELELYLELGALFAAEGRLDQARRQWQRTLEQRLDDPHLCVRLAGLYALHGLTDEALATLERAIALEPRELRHLAELAGVLLRAGRQGELGAVLDRAQAAAGDDPGRLEELADLARGLRDPRRARAALERVLARRPDSPRALRALADLALEAGDRAGATDALRRILATSRDDAARRDATGRLIRLHRRGIQLEELRRAERARTDSDPSAHYVLARIAQLRRRTREAVEHLEHLVGARPGDELGRADLARLYAETGRPAQAIAQFEALIAARPASRGTWLRRIAALHAAERDEDAALACYEEVLTLTPDNAAVFAEVAGHLAGLNQAERAIECLRQAVRLRPDEGRYRLELADLLGEAEDIEGAREQVLAALAAGDESVRERARTWLYEDLVAQGRVEQELARLRALVAQRPYDLEASEALVDLFVRELEYGLALELLGDRLAFDPGNPRLLRRRASLLEEMERWEQALADHGTLARLPGADLEGCLHAQARCALALGDRARAEEALLGAGDPLRVAQTWSRAGLHDEAAAVLEGALVRDPADRELLRQLVRLHERQGELARALAVHDQLLALQGDDWDTLRQRVDLLAAAGDEDGLRDVGARMLDTLVAPVEPDQDSPGTSRVRRRRAVSAQRRDHRQALEELFTLFDGRGLGELYLELATERLRRDPADEELVSLLIILRAPTQQVFFGEQPEVDHAAALALVDEVRALTVGADRLPAGHDAASWTRWLDRREEGLVRADPALALRRAGELAALDGAQLTRDALDERIGLLRAQGEPTQVVEALRLGAERFPDQLEYRAGLALTQVQLADLEPAVRELRRLLPALEAEGERTARRPDDEGTGRLQARRLLERLPDDLRAQAGDGAGLTLYRLSRPSPLGGAWVVGRVPDALDCRVVLARALADLGRGAEALEVLGPAAPSDPEFVEWSAALSALHLELGFDERAAELDQAVFEVVERVGADPVLRHGRTWRPQVRELVGRRAAALRDEDPARAFELARRWTGDETSASRAAELLPVFAERWEAARDGEQGPTRRDAGVLYAELLQAVQRWEEAAEVVRGLIAGEDDLSLLTVLAAYEERAGRPGAAIALFERAMDAERERYAQTGKSTPPSQMLLGPALPDPYALVPRVPQRPGMGPEDQVMFGEFEQAQSFSPLKAGPNLFPMRVQVLRIAWLAGDWERACAEFVALYDESPQAVQYCQWETQGALEARNVGSEALDIYRILHELDPSDSDLVRRLGEALVAEEREEEAIRLYRKFLRGAGPNQYGVTRVESALAELDPDALTATEPALPADLEAAVAADPRNARLRIALVERLLARRCLAHALVHARAAEEHAPHLDEVTRLLDAALVLNGLDDEVEARLDARLERATEADERVRLAVHLADRAWARGDEQGVVRLFERADRRGPLVQSDFTLAGWWLRHDRPERARELLERDRKRLSNQSWYLEEIDQVLASLEAGDANLVHVLESAWEQSAEDEMAAGLAFALGELDYEAAELERLADELGGTRAELYRAAHDLARGAPAEAEERLAARAEADPASRQLLVQAIDLARERGDAAAALALLARLEARYPPSERRRVPTELGELGERQLLGAIRGQLLHARGDDAAAVEAWHAAFRRDGGAGFVARLALAAGLLEVAAQAAGELRAAGERDPALEVPLARALDDRAAELDALEVARAESQERDEAIETRRFELLRLLGRGDELRRELRETLEMNPADLLAAQALVDLTWELDGEQAALDLVRGGFLDLARLGGLRAWAAREVWSRGDRSRALAWTQDELESADEWNRDSFLPQLTDLIVQLDRLDELPQVVARASQGRAAGLRGAARRLGERGLDPERQLAWLDQAAELDPQGDPLADRVRALVALGRGARAVELLAQRAAAGDRAPSELRSACEALTEDGAVPAAERARLAASDDPGDATVLALLLLEDDPARALEALERCQHEGVALDLRWRLLRELERPDEAADALAALLARLDRERHLPDGGGSRAVDSLRQALFGLRLRAAGPEAAVAEFRSDLGWRHAPVDEDDYQLWRLANDYSSRNRDWALANLLWRHGLFEEFARHAQQPAMPGFRRSSSDEQLLQARAWSGERAQVLAELRERYLPAAGAARAPDAWAWPDPRWGFDPGGVRAFAGLAFEAGQLDALLGDLDRAHPLVARCVRRFDFELRGDHAGLAAAIEADGFAPAEHLAEWTAAGRHEQVWQALAARRDRARLPFRDQLQELPFELELGALSYEFGALSSLNAGGMAPGLVHSFSSGPLYYDGQQGVRSSSSWDELDWIAACLRTGRGDEARAAEERALTRGSNLGRARPGLELAGELLDRGLVGPALDLHARVLEAEVVDEPERARLHAAFHWRALTAAAQHGPVERRDALLETCSGLPLPDDPGAAAAARWSRAARFERAGADAQRVRAEVEAARVLDPARAHEPGGTQRAWIALALGEGADARARFEAALGEARLAGRNTTEARYGLGLALAALGRGDEAAPPLRRALAAHPRHERAPAARRALDR